MKRRGYRPTMQRDVGAAFVRAYVLFRWEHPMSDRYLHRATHYDDHRWQLCQWISSWPKDVRGQARISHSLVGVLLMTN